MGSRSRERPVAGIVGAALAALAVGLAWIAPDFRLYQLALVGSLAIAMLGLNILTGYSGQISLGHGAFVGIGAYTAAILVSELAVPYALALVAAAAICFVFGCVVGVPGLRLPGSSLALVTLAFAFALPQVVRKFDGLTGGSYGIFIPLDAQLSSPWTAISDEQLRYLVVVMVGAILFWAGWNLVRGRWGLAMMAGRDHPIAASSMGVGLARTKVTAFGVSAGYAGAAGALQFMVVGYVNPDYLVLAVSFTLVSGIVIGGLGTVAGAVVGALFVFFVPYFAFDVVPAAPSIFTGAATVLFIVVAPAGIIGVVRAAGRRARQPAVFRAGRSDLP